MKFKCTIFFILLLIGCTSSKNLIKKNKSNSSIVYVLPSGVSELLQKKINTNDSVYFTLGNDSNDYQIFLIPINIKQSNYRWIKHTSRVVLLNGKFYPLLLDLDDNFGALETANEIMEKSKAEKYITTTVMLMTGTLYNVKFDKSGKVVYDGY